MSSKHIIQIPSESILRGQLARAISEVKKLELLIDVARKLDEIHDGESQSGVNGRAIDQKPCVAQEKRAVCNRGRWEPQEDDLLHKCVSSSFNPHQGFIAFASDPSNKKRRSKEAAQQRYYAMVTEGKW
jgi:hypothetical protein